MRRIWLLLLPAVLLAADVPEVAELALAVAARGAEVLGDRRIKAAGEGDWDLRQFLAA